MPVTQVTFSKVLEPARLSVIAERDAAALPIGSPAVASSMASRRATEDAER